MMDLAKLVALITNPNIKVEGLEGHTKASELYVVVTFIYENGKYTWSGLIPYYYRRTGTFIESEEELAEYLEKIYPNFSQLALRNWVEQEEKHWNENLSTKNVTKPFFERLLNLGWNSVRYDLPSNPNWARRIQDIKELGYTITTATAMKVKDRDENDTHVRLLPIPRGNPTGYEVFSDKLRMRIIKALQSTNVYELSSANKAGLLPDHKFPEIRWDDSTRAENPETMSDEEIRAKFQLLDNQRNQQKREVCRNCFQTGKRGIVYGIKFYYDGEENWPQNIPKVGAEAEKGCVGCGWYDLQEWRKKLNELTSKKQTK